jgi:hypothetical protein
MRALFDSMLQDPRGERIFDEWVKPRAMDIICDSLSGQMVRWFGPSVPLQVSRLYPAYLREWSFENMSQHQQTRSPKMSFVFFMPL